jgi:hypothetical protein
VAIAVPDNRPASRRTAERPASKKQLAEMTRLLKAVEDDTTPKALAEATSKRIWLKRGIAAVQASGGMIDHCPAAEKPFFEYFDSLHRIMRERMFALGENRSRGDFRVYQLDLERLWREEYGKQEGVAVGTTVVIVERPPRS